MISRISCYLSDFKTLKKPAVVSHPDENIANHIQEQPTIQKQPTIQEQPSIQEQQSNVKDAINFEKPVQNDLENSQLQESLNSNPPKSQIEYSHEKLMEENFELQKNCDDLQREFIKSQKQLVKYMEILSLKTNIQNNLEKHKRQNKNQLKYLKKRNFNIKEAKKNLRQLQRQSALDFVSNDPILSEDTKVFISLMLHKR